MVSSIKPSTPHPTPVLNMLSKSTLTPSRGNSSMPKWLSCFWSKGDKTCPN